MIHNHLSRLRWGLVFKLVMVFIILLIAVSLFPDNPPVVLAVNDIQTSSGSLARGNTDWQIEQVEGGTEVGVYASLALDQTGLPHIAYIHGGSDPDSVMDDSLRYSNKDASGWHSQSVPVSLVEEDEYAYGEVSLKIGQNGYPHISFQNFDLYSFPPKTFDHFLAYAYQDGAGWHVEENIDQVDYLLHTSLALLDGYPHIAYFSSDVFILKYAYKDSSGWHLEDVDTETGVGSHVSLAFGMNDNPMIAYIRDKGGDSDLLFAEKSNLGWQHNEIDTGGIVGRGASLAIDSFGYPQISYSDQTTTDAYTLKYIYHYPSGWYKHIVDENGSVGSYSSIALDIHNSPSIAYYDDFTGDLKYAHWIKGVWYISTVDSEGDVGKYASLALGRWGDAHIAYYDETNGALMYAYQSVEINFLPTLKGD